MQMVKALQGRNLDLCLLRVFAPFCRVAFLPNTNHFEPQVGSQPRQIQFSVKLISELVCCFSSFKSLWQFSVVWGPQGKTYQKVQIRLAIGRVEGGAFQMYRFQKHSLESRHRGVQTWGLRPAPVVDTRQCIGQLWVAAGRWLLAPCEIKLKALLS